MAQGSNRRQGEAGQCNQPGADASQGRDDAAGRHHARQQAVQQAEQAQLCQPAEQGAGKGGDQAEHGQLQAIQAQCLAA